MIFRGKHVFLISDIDNFFYLLADALVHKCGVPSKQIVAVVCKSGRIETLHRKEPFEYVNIDLCSTADLLESRTFIPISLLAWNAQIIKKLIQADQDVLNKTYLYITDDEIDRWSHIKRCNGKLLANERLHVSEDVVSVSKDIKNYIVPRAFFESKLRDILGRNDLRIVDASTIFDILPCAQSEHLREALYARDDITIPRVMIGTKGASIRQVAKVVHACRKIKNVEFIVSSMLVHKRIILDLYLLGIRAILNRKTSIVYLRYLPPAAYSALVASCSYLVLQRRGGGSTARLFAKWGCGQIIVEGNSENGKIFRDIYGVELIEFANPLCLSPGSLANKMVISKNANAVMIEELRSVRVMKKLFNPSQF